MFSCYLQSAIAAPPIPSPQPQSQTANQSSPQVKPTNQLSQPLNQQAKPTPRTSTPAKVNTPSEDLDNEEGGKNLDETIQKKDEDEEMQALRGDMPCLDSSAACILQLQTLAIKNSSGIKAIETSIQQAQDNIKTAKAQGQNFFQQIQPFTALLGAPIFAATTITKTITELGNTSKEDQKNQQTNADLNIKVAQLERTKSELGEKLKDQVLQEAIKFDELRDNAKLQTAIAKRQEGRMKIIEVAYRFGEGATTDMIGRYNELDLSKGRASAARTTMRSQAEKIKRIVLGDS